MCLAQGHNAVMQVRLELTASRSQDKHSATEPLYSHMTQDFGRLPFPEHLGK